MFWVGVDGCPGGWIAIALGDDGASEGVLARKFDELALRWPQALVLVDIPIGLRDAGTHERLCDPAARALIGPRASSVFPAPCRAALREATYEAGSAANRRATGRSLSQQSWAITQRIAEVDDYLRRASASGPVVREMHPEVCFRMLAGRPMAHPKKEPEGAVERMATLRAHVSDAPDIVAATLKTHRRSVLQPDDVLDAFVGAVTARFAEEDALATLPETPERDSRGLRMEMVYARVGLRG